MSRSFICEVIGKHRPAALGTTSTDDRPEAAVVGIAVTPLL
jgi:hypothetical protein